MAGLTPLAACAQAATKNSISVARNPHQGVAIDVLAREVEKATGGRIKIRNLCSAALGSERESIEAVQLGTQDLTLTSTGPVPNFVPETRILDIPFQVCDKSHARAGLDDPIGQDLLKTCEARTACGTCPTASGRSTRRTT